MWLEQKVYSFLCEKNSVNQEDILGNIFLRVNENLTTVKLENLFLKINSCEFDERTKILLIKGWSILQRIIPITGELKINEQLIKMSFNSEELGNVEIIEIENPLFQSNDKQISEQDVENFDKKIIELSSTKKLDEQAGGAGSPHSIPPVINKKYDVGKTRYIANGYIEHQFENFRTLTLEQPEKKPIIILIELIDADNLNQYTNPETTMDNFYQFIDIKNNRKINVKFIENALNVEILELKNV